MPFFLDFLGLQVIRLRFPAKSFSITRADVLRCCKADFGRWRWGDGGVKVGGLAPSMVLSWIVIPLDPPLWSLCNYNAHVIWIVQKRTKKSKRPKSTLAADVSSNTSILPEIYPDTNRLWVHPLTSQAHHLAMDSIPWKSKCFRHTDWTYNAYAFGIDFGNGWISWKTGSTGLNQLIYLSFMSMGGGVKEKILLSLIIFCRN